MFLFLCSKSIFKVFNYVFVFVSCFLVYYINLCLIFMSAMRKLLGFWADHVCVYLHLLQSPYSVGYWCLECADRVCICMRAQSLSA